MLNQVFDIFPFAYSFFVLGSEGDYYYVIGINQIQVVGTDEVGYKTEKLMTRHTQIFSEQIRAGFHRRVPLSHAQAGGAWLNNT